MDLFDHLDALDGVTTCPKCKTKSSAGQPCVSCAEMEAWWADLERPRACPACGAAPMHRKELWRFHGWSPGAADNWTPKWGPCRQQREKPA